MPAVGWSLFRVFPSSRWVLPNRDSAHVCRGATWYAAHGDNWGMLV